MRPVSLLAIALLAVSCRSIDSSDGNARRDQPLPPSRGSLEIRSTAWTSPIGSARAEGDSRPILDTSGLDASAALARTADGARPLPWCLRPFEPAVRAGSSSGFSDWTRTAPEAGIASGVLALVLFLACPDHGAMGKFPHD